MDYSEGMCYNHAEMNGGIRVMTRKKNASAFDSALKYLTPKARTVREVENYLDDMNYSEIEVLNTIGRLEAANLLNDRKYAEDFVESRLNTKPVSRAKLCSQLREHFVPDEIINSVIEMVDDVVEEANAFAVAEKFYRQFEKLNSEERLRRVTLRLQSRGYNYDCIKKCIGRLSDANE